MDNQRLLVWAAFGLMLWFTYQAWVQDYGPRPVTPPPSTEQSAAPSPQADADLPALPEPGSEAPELEATPPPQASVAAGGSSTVRVLTDVLDVEIDTRGGTLQKAVLLRYPVAKDQPDVLVQLLNPTPPDFGLIQTGLRSAGDGPEPNHLAQFEAEAEEYRLDGNDELVVALRWDGGQGVSVVKRFRFARGSYIIGVEQEVANEGESEWRGAEYAQIQRH